MKKLLLLFMSMFFMLGTSVAQEKEEENAAFALQYSTPANGEFTFTVYNIRLQFNKEIVVTLPEGGIAVTNKNTGDVVKITRLDNNEWIEKSTAVFLFEQKTVVGKEGKEELQDLVIDIPGEWSYTIPAGCIKSIDGEEFAEQTFTFTIASSMEIESVSPADAVTKLDKIEITFPKPIASVATNKLSLLDNYWMPAGSFKSEVTYSDDRKTVTLELEEPITTPGTYNLDIYQGVFLSEDGALNNYKYTYFQVIDPTPSFATNINDGDKVKELPDYLEFTFKNVNEVKLVEGADPVYAYLPGGGEVAGTTTLEGNKVIVRFDQKFTEDGTYTYWVPEGLFTMDGVPNEAYTINVVLYTFTITPLEVVSVTPVEGAVEQIEKIVIEFNQTVTLSYDENWQQISREIMLKGEKGEYKLTYTPSSYNASNKLEYSCAEWDGYNYITTPITAPDTYTLNLKDIIVDYAGESYVDDWGYTNTTWHGKNGCIDKSYTWTIGDTAIEGVEAENGEKVIYDLTGRRVENITNAGIYIVNGKKVLVK